MGTRLDKIFDDIIGEDEPSKETQTPPAEEPPKETPPAEEPPPAEEHPAEEPPKEDPPKDTPPAEEPPANDDTPPAEPPKKYKEIPDDPMKRAEFAFKHQLKKQKDKHEKELADRDAKLAEMEKKLAEMEKRMNNPPEAKKTREDFDNDEDYIDYLTDLRVKAALNANNEELAKKEAERQEAEQKKAKEQEELRERQEEWYGHVQEAFGGDQKRSNEFLQKIAYANKNGLGEILDSCPVASDYLINDPMGPLVFEKLLSDRATFGQVFNPQRTNPLAIYYELRRVEEGIRAAAQPPAGGQPPAPAGAPRTVVPPMGRPGKQAGGGALTNTDIFDDPKALRKWLREHR